jgi:hypothetical protein
VSGTDPVTDPAADPVTASVIQASLVAAADEMFAVLRKTAMSPIIYEVLDVGTGVTDFNINRNVINGSGQRGIFLNNISGAPDGELFAEGDHRLASRMELIISSLTGLAVSLRTERRFRTTSR